MAASVLQSTQGIAATDHDILGKLPVETTGPETAKAIAPRAAADAENRRARNSHAPAAATGKGRSTQRLKLKTSGPMTRIARTGRRNIWCSASATADCPPPIYGSQS